MLSLMQSDLISSTPEKSPVDSFDLWIEAGNTEKNYWLDLWRYRELLFILAWRDVAVRYKQAVAGASWALIQPLLSMLIMTLIFGKVAGLPSQEGAPYAVMVFAAMLPWQFFSNALSLSSQSVVANAHMISKVYFPRMLIPSASVLVSLVDFLVSFLILGGVMVWYQFWPSWRLLTLPFFIALAMISALGPGLLMTALSVRFRDVRFIVPFIVQFGMYISPVPYSSDVIRGKLGDGWFFVYSLNPLVGVIDGFRWAILGGDASLFTLPMGLSVLISVTSLVLGIFYFRKTERSFADVI